MKKVKNIIKNKDLINIFKRSKLRNFKNKKVLKKKTFYFLKFKIIFCTHINIYKYSFLYKQKKQVSMQITSIRLSHLLKLTNFFI